MQQPLSSRQNDASANLAAVRARMMAAATQAGRDPASVTLIAVSKFHGRASIAPVLSAGQQDFGENRVQEAASKWPALRMENPACRLHLIGPLQTNKVREAMQLFDVIHTLDRPKLARRIADEIAAKGRAPQLFIQVNIGEEPQKAGIAPQYADDFIAQCRTGFGLTVTGLMCIPPAGQPASGYFERLAQIAAYNGLANLSMGMSDDFEQAIQFGATHIRVGSAIFGARM